MTVREQKKQETRPADRGSVTPSASQPAYEERKTLRAADVSPSQQHMPKKVITHKTSPS